MGEWIHIGTPKSTRFKCDKCGEIVYYQQANNVRKENEAKYMNKIPYPHCPYCLDKKTTK